MNSDENANTLPQSEPDGLPKDDPSKAPESGEKPEAEEAAHTTSEPNSPTAEVTARR